MEVSTTSSATSTQASSNNDHEETLDFDPGLSEEERRFYIRAYPNVELVRERKVHCTICKMHIGTAPVQEEIIKMHPVLRVTHCTKCHDFYNSGEFSKGEDGSELYCRWCGQGGEVYCCSSCPYVFCKSCIVKNLSRGVVADIEQNENWNCFSCAPKILWPLRAQHWALIRYIAKQKKHIEATCSNESEKKSLLSQDRSTCCRLAKSKCGNMSDSMESLDSTASRRSHNSTSAKKQAKSPASHSQTPAAKRLKTSNDEVVCTPDLLSMLEPDCQITVQQQKSRPSPSPLTSTPKIISLQSNAQTQNSGGITLNPHNNTPPPLVLRNTGIPMRHPSPAPVVRRTIIGARNATPTGSHTPVYHTINGYRIDLNSAAQQETFRLPNGKLIQVKRQGTNKVPVTGSPQPANNPWMRQTSPITSIQHAASGRPIQITPASSHAAQHYYTVHQQQQQHHQQQNTMHHPQMIRYNNTTVTPVGSQNGAVRGPQIQVINGVPVAPTVTQTTAPAQNAATAVRAPLMVRHVFPDTAFGQARTQLQEQVFNAMEICQHLTGKVQTLTNSNAYKTARNYLEVKELYIHLSYLLTYAIGRFKGLQDKCLADMRQLGFVNDADSLENGQLAAGVDYVRYGQLEDIDLFNTSSNSFHNQVYEYRKSLYANLENGDGDNKKPPLSPLMPLGQSRRNADGDAGEDDEEDYNDMNDETGETNWMKNNDTTVMGDMSEMESTYKEAESYYNNDTAFDETANEDAEMTAEVDLDEEDVDADVADGGDFEQYAAQQTSHYSNKAHYGTEDYMSHEEQTHARDRKLARLIQQYPAIWCTRHPDYGNFEVTRKHWRTIASHFKRTENIKLRWKNIRKRYVRVERRVRDGKRFNGYFDKTTNFLANRDLPEDQWVEVDVGSEDGDGFDRKQLDMIEKKLHKDEKSRLWNEKNAGDGNDNYGIPSEDSEQPIEVRALDMKIINFVKCNPVLWRKSPDPQYNHIDEQSRKSLWMHLWKTTRLQNLTCEDIMDRWAHLYEMYKSFRLKTIKDETKRANLELKYSKYLAKLYFLYKIVEEDLRNEHWNNIDIDLTKDMPESDQRMQDEPDDKEFMVQLVRCVQRNDILWDKLNIDYFDTVLRSNIWQDIASELKDFKRDAETIKKRWQLALYSYQRYRRERRTFPKDKPLPKYCRNLPVEEMFFLDKQASDDEDNEIEIVEPKTDTITLDSDNEDDEPVKQTTTSPKKPQIITINSSTPISSNILAQAQQQHQSTNNDVGLQKLKQVLLLPKNTTISSSAPIYSATNAAAAVSSAVSTENRSVIVANDEKRMEEMDMMSAAKTFLVSLLEVDSDAGDGDSMSQQQQRKQPRKKTTNKPNPTLLKQKEMLERERLEEMKRNDLKLKMKCAISLKKAEEEFPFAKDMLEKHESELKAAAEAKAEKLKEITAENDTNIDETDTKKEENTDNNETMNDSGEVEILTVDLESSIDDGKDNEIVLREESSGNKDGEEEDEGKDNSKKYTIVMDDDEDGKEKSLIIEVEGNNSNEKESLKVVIDAKSMDKDGSDDLVVNEKTADASEKHTKNKTETVSECAKRVMESLQAIEKQKEMENKDEQANKFVAVEIARSTTASIDAYVTADDTIEPILVDESDAADLDESPIKRKLSTSVNDKSVAVGSTTTGCDRKETDDEVHKAAEVDPVTSVAELNEPEIDVEKEIEKLLSNKEEPVPESETQTDAASDGEKASVAPQSIAEASTAQDDAPALNELVDNLMECENAALT